MPLLFSLYLDLIRFAAALAVFLDHLSTEPFSRDVVRGGLGQYGEIAVTIFFLLSGYVIAHVSATRERGAAAYFCSRAARLYSVVLVALVLTFVLDRIGAALNPVFYAEPKLLAKPGGWQGYLSSLLFVNEYQVFGFHGIAPGTNGPYWSLSFEASYYLIAGLVLFARRAVGLPLVLLLLALAGKTIAALLPVWALGFWLCRVQRRWGGAGGIGAGLAWVALLCSGAALLAMPFIDKPYGAMFWFPYGRGPFNRDVLQDYLVAGLFALHLTAARAALTGGDGRGAPVRPHRLQHPVRWLGSLTFPLYCMHYPVLSLAAAISPWDKSSLSHVAFACAMTALPVAALTPLCDALKEKIRTLLLRLPSRGRS
jgi:peptidoglycan/LPS O-acetylase OafA/YrhL